MLLHITNAIQKWVQSYMEHSSSFKIAKTGRK